MAMNIEQRLEQSAKSIEQSSQKAHDFAEKDTTIQTCAGSRDSLPKVSRIWQENFARQMNQHATEFQDRFALSQQSLPWQAGITISDSLQRYHVGVQGEEGYKEFLPNPVKLPFETAATLAEDLTQDRWLENGVPNKHWAESKVASALEKSLGANARIWPKDRDLVVGDVIPAPEETADGLPITHLVVSGNAYAMSPIASGQVTNLTSSGAVIGGSSTSLLNKTIEVPTASEIKQRGFAVGSIVKTQFNNLVTRKGSATYIVMTQDDYGMTPDGYCDLVVGGSSGNVAVLQPDASTDGYCFGMMYDGVTDDADAYEAASNKLAERGFAFQHPAKSFKIGRNVTIRGKIKQRGISGHTPFNLSTIALVGDFEIKTEANEPLFEHILFQGNSESGGTNALYCTTTDPENDQNVDAKLNYCSFFLVEEAVVIEGRGITFNSCDFSLFRAALRIEWPNPFTPPSSLIEQSLQFGMRGYNFFDCKWHASPGYIIRNLGYNKDNLRGVTITGYPDTQVQIVDGSLNDFLVNVNYLYGNQPILHVKDNHVVTNGKVTGVFSGEKDPSTADKGFANLLVQTGGFIDDVTFDGEFRDVKGDAFRFAGGQTGDVRIKGVFSQIMKQNSQTLTGFATRYLINATGGKVTGVVSFEGTISVENYTNNPTYLVTGLDDAHFFQGLVAKPEYIQVFGGNIRGRAGNVSRHKYTGDGTVNRLITLPTVAQYVFVCGANPQAQQGFAAIAYETSYGGVGDAVMTDSKTLRVTDDANVFGAVYQYIVHY
ncbi:hypothetical protein ACVH52_001242 [Vibrio cholerae]